MSSARKIDPRLVYVKTEAGAIEITSRKLGLTQGARRLLIMVDGRRALSELPGTVRPGDMTPLIEQLEELGLIALAGISEKAPELSAPEIEALAYYKPIFAGMFERELELLGKVFDARVQDAVSLDVMRLSLREGIDRIKKDRPEEVSRKVIDFTRSALARKPEKLRGPKEADATKARSSEEPPTA